jgi:hypothetical protein
MAGVQNQCAFTDVRRAREENYVSRAAYKLLQIDDRLRILRRGMCVVDCGARPGKLRCPGWRPPVVPSPVVRRSIVCACRWMDTGRCAARGGPATRPRDSRRGGHPPVCTAPEYTNCMPGQRA